MYYLQFKIINSYQPGDIGTCIAPYPLTTSVPNTSGP